MSGVDPDIFWPRVDKTGDCWIWLGKLYKGYGRYAKGRFAHRITYELLVGPIPAGFQLDHLCRNPPCVNPAHLEPVTGAENRRRQYESVTHCKHGHEFTPENTYLQGRSRTCRTCQREAVRRYAARKKAAACNTT